MTTGKHAKETNTKAATRKIALGGALLGGAIIPVAAAGSASAASQDQWDRIAACESGDQYVPGSGRWDLSYGDADSTGGLQIQQRTWDDYNGQEFASAPYLASRHDQIVVAERILADQGASAWVCNQPGHGIASGALGAGTGGSVLNGGTDPFGEEPAPPADPPADDPAPAPDWAGHYTVVSGDSLSAIAAGFGVDWHDLYAANVDVVGPDPDVIEVGMVLTTPWTPPFDGTTSDGGPAPAPGEDEPPAPPEADHYTVVSGDTLYGIAVSHGIGDGGPDTWKPLYQANLDVVGDNPDLILPGQVLVLPGPGTPPGDGQDCQTSQCEGEPAPPAADDGQYTVKAGDTLWGLSYAFNVSVDDLMRWNGLTSDLIDVGQVLTVVDPGTPATPAPPAEEPPADPGPGASGWVRPVPGAVTGGYHTPGSAWSLGFHTGVDFHAGYGTPIHAVGPGTVVVSTGSGGAGGSYGNHVVIDHGNGVYTLYAHMSAREVWDGQHVDAGDEIGHVGATGNASGPHLHFEVRNDPTAFNAGVFSDPVAFLADHGVDL